MAWDAMWQDVYRLADLTVERVMVEFEAAAPHDRRGIVSRL